MNEWTVFGFSHFFGDIFDCIESQNCAWLKTVVLNVVEKEILGRANLSARISRLPYPVDVVKLGEFGFTDPEMNYVIGFSGKLMVPLLEGLKYHAKMQKHELYFSKLIHGRAIVQSGAILGEGVIVDAGAIVGPWATIGKHTILNRGSSVGHDCEVGDYCFLGPSATLCSHVRLGHGVKIGANATVLPDIHIGEDAVIGAGAVVTKNVPVGATVFGVPAVRRGP